jgi:Phosphotransferase enzyme family
VTELASPTDQKLLALANRLVGSAGRGRANALSRLDGGKNNQVYRVATDAGDAVVLKSYFSDPRDPRDRLAAEWGFLRHTWSRGVRAVPEPLASDPTVRAGLYGFVRGRKLLATELKPRYIDAAIDFVLAVNAAPRTPGALAPASEACFSLSDHIATVERRVARLAALDPDSPHVQDAQRLVDESLLPKWSAVKARLTKDAHDAGLEISLTLRPDECCLSPSDFGFHNALADETGRVTFLDFEYAGRDDPAKLVSDFFCQPEIPVPLSYHPSFLTRLADGLELDDAGRARCRILLDAYRVKWSCIILNDFLPVGAARRSFADAGAWDIRCKQQIKKAEAKIGEIPA